MSFLTCGVLDKVQFIYFFPWTACTLVLQLRSVSHSVVDVNLCDLESGGDVLNIQGHKDLYLCLFLRVL